MPDDDPSFAEDSGERNDQIISNTSTTKTLGHKIRSLWSREQSESDRPGRSDESTPLLARDSIDEERDDASIASEASGSAPLLERPPSKSPSKRRASTIIALVMLCLAAVAILGLGFAAPEAMQEYAEQAPVFEPTKLSIESFTTDGVNARIQGDFYLDASRVRKGSVRNIGKWMTWIASAIETKPTKVTVSLPEYDIILGSAELPPIVVSIRNMQKSHIDVVVKVVPGDVKGLRRIAEDWIDGRLGQLRLKGKADVGLKSGIFPLGSRKIIQTLTFEHGQIPTVPKYSISKFKVHETNLPDGDTAISADVSVSTYNEYPISFSVPPLAFEIMVPGCSAEAPFLLLANATSEEIQLEPSSSVAINGHGTVRQLSETLISICPGTTLSPLDSLLGEYIHGHETKMFVRGSQNPLPDTPTWISEILKNVLVPVPFSGNSMDDLIRNFSMEDTHFSLPNPLADPDTPEAQPRISTEILVLANLPEEINFSIEVSRVRSVADVFYEGKKFGVLELRRWQNATSHLIDGHNGSPRALAVQATIQDAPVGISDQDTFTDVIQEVLFGGKVTLDVKALVDIEITTALGTFTIRKVPAKGKVPLEPVLGDGLSESFSPSVGGLEIWKTTSNSIWLNASANATNPTKYSASIPYVNVNLMHNGTILGNISLEGLQIKPGENSGIPFSAIWDPIGLSGEEGAVVGRGILSKYISGINSSLTIRTHEQTFPSAPWLGAALSFFTVNFTTPRLGSPKIPNKPGDGDSGDRPHFIDDATMHLFSSTADFTLLSPFRETTLYITYVNATAIYNHTDPVGVITYDLPIAVPPGATRTPRLPVDWSLGGVGYDAVKEALGGTLRLGAKANVTVRIEDWVQNVHFEGDGIGAHIQI